MPTTPKCPNCPSSNFAATPIDARGSGVKLTAIHCASCGSIVGITEPYSVIVLLEKLAKKLNIHDL
jgi:transcription elongation factor Elf1